jgi:hypothetical protein
VSVIEKIKKIYPENGFNKTKKILKIGDIKLRRIINENNIEKNGKIIMDLDNKYFAYLLGLIWSDGYLSLKSNTVHIECVESDMVFFKEIFEKLGKWSYYKRKREYKPSVNAYITDKWFYKLLIENDFLNKSIESPNKIYNLLPNISKGYFLLGIIDGDGCFYYNKKNYTKQFILTGSLEQKWDLYEKVFDNMGIKYKIIRIDKKTKYSQLRITNKVGISKLGKLIYDDLVVLNRKYNKYKLIVS